MTPLPAAFVKGVTSLEQLPRAFIPEVAASGRSNVGKSTLLNVLFGRKGLAKVSGTPGKTREINFFSIGDRYHLVDLPGYGYARVPITVKRKWAALVQRYLETREQLAGVIQLIDLRHDPTEQDRQMLEWLAGSCPALIVATKSDKLKRGARAAALKKLRELAPAEIPIVGFSAVTRDGRKEILGWIDRALVEWRNGNLLERGEGH
jgi:GTP-binding protein